MARNILLLEWEASFDISCEIIVHDWYVLLNGWEEYSRYVIDKFFREWGIIGGVPDSIPDLGCFSSCWMIVGKTFENLFGRYVAFNDRMVCGEGNSTWVEG